MAKGKKSTPRKAAAGKALSKPKPRNPSIKKSAAKRGIGDNNPPKEHVPPPTQPFMGWLTDNSAQVAHAIAARQRSLRATTGIVTVGTPLAMAYPTHLHQVMLNRIAALEDIIRKLPTPLSEEVEEVKRELAKLKALPPVPTQLPTDVVQAPSKLEKIGEKVLVGVATGLATQVASAAAKELWTTCGHHLIEAARAIADWIASLPPPP
jgi:hypothetical protein